MKYKSGIHEIGGRWVSKRNRERERERERERGGGGRQEGRKEGETGTEKQ